MPNKLQSNPCLTLAVTALNSKFKLALQLTFALCAVYIGSVQALPEDRQQPIDVVADNAIMNDKTGITVLTGSVKIVQGTMLMTADRLEIFRDSQGDINKMISTGKPAYFTQQQQPEQPYSKAWGEHMLYSVAKQTVTITGNARVEQLQDKFTGETVIYHMDKAIVNAIGGKQRVKMIIQPKGNK
ncbi:MAG: lipopolysaccharide transport periplasmic protein LptA [Pseudomonadales bacterium]|nr:lipopolysaccharide transport periplasmic protein LptA [Pseudomonadales bacterium]NRA18671.1 lipopolysaccharide transport periplasmic protein LptA [Oceanospirillaceae bacterium]